MNKPFNQKADEAVKKAADEYEAANQSYVRTIRRFISSNSFIPGEEIRHPEAVLDMSGLKEYEEAWVRVQEKSNKLRRAFMKLYSAYQ